MLEITILGTEMFNEETNEIFTVGDRKVRLEHSLISISKWESKFAIPFLNNKEVTPEQMLYYIECMIIDDDAKEVVNKLSSSNVQEINDYLSKKVTATWFKEDNLTHGRRINSEIITSELIYFWMVSYNIPIETETWHISRLLTLIQVCNEKNKKPRKRSMKDMASERRALNQARQAKHNTTG